MSQRDELQQFVDKYGHLKVFRESDELDLEETDFSFVGNIKQMIKNAVSYTSFSVEGLSRPIDLAHQETSKTSTDYCHTNWEKSNTIRKNTVFTIDLYSTSKSFSKHSEISYCINLTMMDIECMKSVTFNNLSLQELRKAVKELVEMQNELIFNI